ncbi:MAG: site-2 protease family protein [Treponemataceae bacterium]|nr:site-2 protease family protein [Treponemataceae bacterium]
MRILYGLLCLFFLVLFHEWGHFLAAKLFGVTVESFSIGFGPVLLHRRRGKTDYRLSLIPLGGYCGMKGQKDFERSLEAGLDHIEAEPDSLYGVAPCRRMAIAFAGPLFNFFFAFLAFSAISMIGYTYYSYSNRIILADEVHPDMHSAARDAGLQSGDEIIQINRTEIRNFSDILAEITSRPDETVSITVLRDGGQLEFSARTDLDRETGAGRLGIMAADTSGMQEYEAERRSFFPALWQGLKDAGMAAVLTVKGIATLFKGVNLQESVSGPARIIDMMGTVVTESFSEGARAGFVNMLNILAYISISLCVMNLLPVPILDGGLILFAAIEWLTRKKMPPKLLYYIQFVGLALIAVLFAIGFSGDIAYFAKHIRGTK